jgi:hypothetical protein
LLHLKDISAPARENSMAACEQFDGMLIQIFTFHKVTPKILIKVFPTNREAQRANLLKGRDAKPPA